MYRVYTMVGNYRYYYAGNHWVQWGFAARVMSFNQAQQVAQSEQAELEQV